MVGAFEPLGSVCSLGWLSVVLAHCCCWEEIFRPKAQSSRVVASSVLEVCGLGDPMGWSLSDTCCPSSCPSTPRRFHAAGALKDQRVGEIELQHREVFEAKLVPNHQLEKLKCSSQLLFNIDFR